MDASVAPGDRTVELLSPFDCRAVLMPADPTRLRLNPTLTGALAAFPDFNAVGIRQQRTTLTEVSPPASDGTL